MNSHVVLVMYVSYVVYYEYTCVTLSSKFVTVFARDAFSITVRYMSFWIPHNLVAHINTI